MWKPENHRVALLFNGNKAFDREVIAGIAAYLSSTRRSWDLFLEEDFRLRLQGIERWQGDGIIAHFDDPAVAEALAGSQVPVVAVGSSREHRADYPPGLPYVASDDSKLVRIAYEHLIETGLRRFALFSQPEAPDNPAARQREEAFRALMRRDKFKIEIYRGQSTSAQTWDESVQQQIRWLEGLPKPVGIIAISDARARQLMQACTLAGIAVPEQVSVVGLDNDPLAQMLTRISLSSVIPGAEEMGRTAAHLMDQLLHGVRVADTRILVPPAGIKAQVSSRHEPARHPHVMRARHFIRQYACQGIKTDQVADYVGISRSSLESYFRRELGCSVHKEILRMRLDAATDMLKSGKCSLPEVADRCGFSSSQYMNAVFRRELGCTPRGYQERITQEQAAPAEDQLPLARQVAALQLRPLARCVPITASYRVSEEVLPAA
jgi:LacI family transcriptional regulator